MLVILNYESRNHVKWQYWKESVIFVPQNLIASATTFNSLLFDFSF